MLRMMLAIASPPTWPAFSGSRSLRQKSVGRNGVNSIDATRFFKSRSDLRISVPADSTRREHEMVPGSRKWSTMFKFLLLAFLLFPLTSSLGQIPDLNRYGFDAKRSMESACSNDRVLRGAAAYAACLQGQIAQYERGVPIPDLTRFGFDAKRSMESACSNDRVLRGAAAYAACLQGQIAQYERGVPIPDLTRFGFDAKRSMESACSNDRVLRGAAAYATCLQGQVAQYERGVPIPDLTRFAFDVKRSMESACSNDRILRGPAAYALCLNSQIASVEASVNNVSGPNTGAVRLPASKPASEVRAERVNPQAVTESPRNAHALVIGNASYVGSARLENPINDATAISEKLRSMGFVVTAVIDANRHGLIQALGQFRKSAAASDLSLLFYSGHGVQMAGINYILPIDIDQTDPANAAIQGVSLDFVIDKFLPGKIKIVFLDACRDNPLHRTSARSVSRGLAPVSVTHGTLISYATRDGHVALDGVGQNNSPFTQALLEHLADPYDIAVVLRKVRERVMLATGGKQQPWEYGSLTGGELVLSKNNRRSP
jgi:hypothetical protein